MRAAAAWLWGCCLAQKAEKFTSETESLMNILVDSLYTDTDIFLREVLSNANDAIERAIAEETNSTSTATSQHKIRITIDDKQDRLFIEDNGIGMCEDQLRSQLGTIANSQTREKIKSGTIGYFGVGFYSTFLVSDEVEVHSKCASSPEVNSWKNIGRSFFSIQKSPRPALFDRTAAHALGGPEGAGASGTVVELKLKKKFRKVYLNKSNLVKIINKNNKFIRHPIYLKHAREKGLGERVSQGKPALWLRDPTTITEAEYDAFYRENWAMKDTPLAFTHFQVETKDVRFTGLLYVPDRRKKSESAAPQDVLDDIDSRDGNFQLYVQQVLVNENRLLPGWLNFVHGVIDSNDTAKLLKVDRQGLRDSKVVRVLKRKLLMKTFDMFQNEVRDYSAFWKSYSHNLALGCSHEGDKSVKKRILELFELPICPKDTEGSVPQAAGGLNTRVRLREYVDKYMIPQKQTKIFYVGGEEFGGPLFEIFNKHNITVLQAPGPFDESCLNEETFENHPLVSIEKENGLSFEDLARFELGETSALTEVLKRRDELEKAHQSAVKEFRPLIDRVKNHTREIVDVKISKRLIDSPFLISVPEFGLTSSYAKMVKGQIGGSSEHLKDLLARVKILELNPDHEVSRALLDHSKTSSLLPIVIQTAYLAAGYEPSQPKLLARFAVRALEHELDIASAPAKPPSEEL